VVIAMAQSPDCIVIGGGMIGCSVAAALARRGVSVTLLERGRIGDGAPRAAAGMVWPTMRSASRDGWFDLCLAASQAYGDVVRWLADETGLDPEYRRPGALRVANGPAERAEHRAKGEWMRAAGVDVSWLEIEEARRLEPGLAADLAGALWLPAAAQVRGDLMAAALARAAALRGADVREHVAVAAIERRGDTIAGVISSEGPLSAKHVVLAAGAWSGLLSNALPSPLPVRPIKGQSLLAEAPAGWLRHVVAGTAADLIPRAGGRVYIGATVEDVGFDTRPTLGEIAGRIHGADRLMPGAGSLPFLETRVGLRPATPALVPVVGPVPECRGLFAATAHYRNGVLLGPLTGDAVADLILGDETREGRVALDLFERAGALTAGAR
jgi:glycine oxidase